MNERMHCRLMDQQHREPFSQTYLDNECLQHTGKRRSDFKKTKRQLIITMTPVTIDTVDDVLECYCVYFLQMGSVLSQYQ